MHEMASHGTEHYNFRHRFTRKKKYVIFDGIGSSPRGPISYSSSILSVSGYLKKKSNIKMF